ncbi:MAG: EscU/YscU/HrcU family type III secretion system export apparatus switch protein [Gemmataceae bacterium]|nr:EscU/YscU/HrcU family type III secretion system export apparatus switch protein [Gemmataceae bacterium]
MADEQRDSRTEPATQRKRQDAREQGQVAVSQDLYAGAMILIGVAVLAFAGRQFAVSMLDEVRVGLSGCAVKNLDIDAANSRLGEMLGRGAEHVGVMLALLFLAALGLGVLQVGFQIVPDLLGFKGERLAQGASKIFSSSAISNMLATTGKLLAAAAVAWWLLRGRMNDLFIVDDSTAGSWASRAAGVVGYFAIGIAATLLLLGVLDYAWQRWQHEQKLMMTKQEIKEEMKNEDGDPQVKARIRRLQRERARKMMFHEVPKASVVITNPTHLAIALRYEPGMRAPRVVAKGAGLVAKRIVEAARKHEVFVVERKPLARALFKSVQLGQEIPVRLYFAVSELINHVYGLKRNRMGAM